jgi:tetratricopeptide (TPR) repeat protein
MGLQQDDIKSDGPDWRSGNKGQDAATPSGGRDYLAIGILVFLLVALVVTGYLSLKTIAKGYDFRSEKSIREWAQGLEEKAKDWLEHKARIGREKKIADRGHLAEGYRLYRKRNYAGALKEFDRAVQKDAGNPEAYFWRGRALIGEGRLEQAAEDFQKAVTLKPDYAEAYDTLGWLFSRRGEFDSAIEALSKSIELKPENGWAYYQRGRVFFEKGDRDRALADEEKSCKLGYQEGCKAYQEFKSGD